MIMDKYKFLNQIKVIFNSITFDKLDNVFSFTIQNDN